MSRVFVHGCGAVSPAGWGIAPLRETVARAVPVATGELSRPGWEKPLTVRRTPAPQVRPGFLAHARLRRTSPISQYIAAAALEAIGPDAALISAGKIRLGIVLCAMSGCVNYSRRFYDETLRDPATASPLVFPETVFNAPASHLAALLGTPAKNYTLVGDPGTFLQGLALAATWLLEKHAEACVVVGGEECDWLTSDAYRLFSRQIVLSDGAGAVYLKTSPEGGMEVELKSVTDSNLYLPGQSRTQAARKARAELPAGAENEILCDGSMDLPRLDAAEAAAWRNWRGARLSPKKTLGEGLMAAAAWQCVVAIDALQQNGYTAANVSVVGCNQAAIAARFVNLKDGS